jgi:hypothetical protein
MIECESREVDDLVVVHAAHHDHVHLDGSEAGCFCGVRRDHRIESQVASRDRRDAIRSQAVGADVDAIESRDA